jgi:hypothetical protein
MKSGQTPGSQTTLNGNFISNKETTLCGVPQGPVLGPGNGLLITLARLP